ncbi:glycosyltransferase involved in cell wall biosynthesis [Silicimonas algicola]|uniref:Glycosyltransferase involved in cell wall biosynthesis n=1 Tax=Silicimonas algicola TaxID=1826607 RepID=A0A316FX43_9RHOB|nr:glycosyltransferase involved in cell wall biosynthesis [Silicimonas algicola]
MGADSVVMAIGRRMSEPGLEIFQQDWAWVPGVKHLMYSTSLINALDQAARKGAVIHGHGLWLMPNIRPARIAARHGVPFLVSPRGMLGPEALAFSSRRKKVMWALAQHNALELADCFHATSVAEYEDIRRMSLRAPVAVIPNGIHIPVGEPNPAYTILYLGRLHPKKGIDRLIEAWARLAIDFPDWRLRIVGPSEIGCREALEAQVVRLAVPRVCFEDALRGDDKWSAYREAGLFVLPTLNENFGMVVAEALATGTPVISSKGAPWSGLVEERCGWWVDHGVEALEAALRRALAISPEERLVMGRRGREWMKREFGWESIAERMAATYAWCLGEGERPECVVQ